MEHKLFKLVVTIFKNRHLRRIFVIAIGGVMIIGSFVFFVKKNLLLSEAVSTFLGLLVGLFLYEVSLFVDGIAEDKKIPEELVKEVKKFNRKFSGISNNFGKRPTTAEDIAEANALIDKVLESQK